MRERPILFSGPMVRALLDGRKTQTRRVMKQAVGPSLSVGIDDETAVAELSWLYGDGPGHDVHERIKKVACPHGAPGDRLWVREAWRVGKPLDDTAPRDILPPLIERGKGVTVLYQDGGWRSVGPRDREEPVYPDDIPLPEWAGKARPSMFMPRAFSRITLEITIVRVERLQDISEEDARSEGAIHSPLLPMGWNKPGCDPQDGAMRSRFAALWDGLNAARGAGWDVNPWVWVVEFKRIDA